MRLLEQEYVPDEKITTVIYATLFFSILSAITNINSYDGYLPAWVGWMCLGLWGTFQIVMITGIRPEKIHWPMWIFTGSFALFGAWPIIFGDFVPWPRRTPYFDYANPDIVIWSRIIGIISCGIVGAAYYRAYLSWKGNKQEPGIRPWPRKESKKGTGDEQSTETVTSDS